MKYPSYAEFPSEAEWTKSGHDCDRVHRYHAADADSTEFEVLELIAAFVRALQPSVVLETGSAFGYGSQAIGEALRANGHGKLLSLERSPERAEIARKRCIGLPVEIIEADSLMWTPPMEPIQFAFFDSLTDIRHLEFKRYYNWFSRGAIVAFHDTGPQHVVWNAVAGLQQERLLKAIKLRTPRGVAFAEVLN